MTRRQWTEAMLLDDAHPETWTEADRDAYLRWRLTDFAEWARTYPKAERLTYYRAAIKGSVLNLLEERQRLYRPRYRRCACARCLKPFVSQAEFDAWLERRPELRRLARQTAMALLEIERHKPRTAA